MRKIQEIIDNAARKTTGLLGVGYKNLMTGDEYYLNGDKRFPSASVFKVPVLVELFNQLEQGTISMDTLVELKAEEISLGSGVLNRLSPGIKLPLRDYAMLMMTVSDNTATDYIVRLVGKDNVRKMITKMGLANTTVDYTCNELILAGWSVPIDTTREKALEIAESGEYTRNEAMYNDPDAMNDWTSPWDMTRIFELIYKKEIVSEKACDGMMAIMERCDTNHRIPYLLPKAGDDAVQKVIHKTGTLFKIVNDAGIIVSGKSTFILSLFYNGYNASEEEMKNPGASFGERLLAELARDVYAELHR